MHSNKDLPHPKNKQIFLKKKKREREKRIGLKRKKSQVEISKIESLKQ